VSDFIQHLSEVIPEHLRKGVQEELLRGWRMEETKAKHQARQLGAFFKQNEAKSIEGMGRLVGEIPSTSYHYWGQRLGYDCWKDDEFVKEFFQDNPECAVSNYAKKATVNGAIFTADGYLTQ
jgi:hypothetical protein